MTAERPDADLRNRILAATLETVGTAGYATTTVEDIIRAAGISRRTFYECFPNKEACFLAAFDQVLDDWQLDNAVELRRRASVEAADWILVVRAALTMLLEQAREDPRGARILFVEAWAAGAASRRRAAAALDDLAHLLAHLLRGPESTPQIHDAVALCLAAGVVELLANRCLDRRIEDLLGLVDELADWIGAYRYAVAVDVIQDARMELVDPGPIVLTPPVHPLPLGYSASVVAGRRGGDPVQRILAAIPAAAADTDGGELSVNEIVRRAHVSQHTFREHFASAEEALNATALAVAQGARGYFAAYMLAAGDWETSVLAGLVALPEYFSLRPELGRFLYSHVVTESGRKLRNMLISFWAGTMLVGCRRYEGPHQIVAEGIGGGVVRTILQALIRGNGEEVGRLGSPLAYFALVPFVGAERAVAALERSMRRSRGDTSSPAQRPLPDLASSDRDGGTRISPLCEPAG